MQVITHSSNRVTSLAALHHSVEQFYSLSQPFRDPSNSIIVFSSTIMLKNMVMISVSEEWMQHFFIAGWIVIHPSPPPSHSLKSLSMTRIFQSFFDMESLLMSPLLQIVPPQILAPIRITHHVLLSQMLWKHLVRLCQISSNLTPSQMTIHSLVWYSLLILHSLIQLHSN